MWFVAWLQKILWTRQGNVTTLHSILADNAIFIKTVSSHLVNHFHHCNFNLIDKNFPYHYITYRFYNTTGKGILVPALLFPKICFCFMNKLTMMSVNFWCNKGHNLKKKLASREIHLCVDRVLFTLLLAPFLFYTSSYFVKGESMFSRRLLTLLTVYESVWCWAGSIQHVFFAVVCFGFFFFFILLLPCL